MALVARILIVDPADEVRELLARSVARLGHDPVVYDAAAERPLPDVDVAVVEPSAPSSVRLVEALRGRRPCLPVVCVSIKPRSADVAALAPTAYLLKPFHLRDLERALAAAIAQLSSPNER